MAGAGLAGSLVTVGSLAHQAIQVSAVCPDTVDIRVQVLVGIPDTVAFAGSRGIPDLVDQVAIRGSVGCLATPDLVAQVVTRDFQD